MYPQKNVQTQFFFPMNTRHSLARTIDSDLHPDVAANNNSESTRLRRSSSIEAPNIELLLLENDDQQPEVIKNGVRAPRLQRQKSIDDIEKANCKLEPKIEGRIVIIDAGTLPALLHDRQKWDQTVIDKTIPESVENWLDFIYSLP